MKVIDFHTHAFPDSLAKRAIDALEAQTEDAKAYLDGTIDSLLASMDSAGIDTAVIANIATKVSQFEPILKWSRQIASERLIPFASLHPSDPEPRARIREIAEQGFKGVKLHPYYQDFIFDDPAMFPLYHEIAKHKLIFLSHTGFDIAFPRTRIADPVRIVRVLNEVPDLLLVCSHLGAWQDWDEVDRLLLGRPIYIEISFSLNSLSAERAKQLIGSHRSDRILFGTDSPWDDQKTALRRVLDLNLEEWLLENLLYRNAERLLAL